MLTPLQISTQRFAPNGKGGYRAADVDAFMQKVYKSYSKLYNDFNAVNERLQTISPTLDEYNKNKAAIANALISAQTVAESMTEKAQTEAAIIIDAANKSADSIVESRKEEAERYYLDKTQQADIRLRELEYAYDKLQKEADDFREAYISRVNAQIETLIADANEKAAEIVAAAYNDAKLAKDKAEEALTSANAQLQAVMAETAKIKGELSALIIVADSAVKSISDYDIEAVPSNDTEAVLAKSIDIASLDKFNLDVKIEPIPEEVSALTAEEDEIEEVEVVEEDREEISSAATDEIVDLFSHSSDSSKDKNEIPDVSSYLSKIFDSVSDDDESFGFDNLISESK